jgi:hypothetical protein
MKPVILIVAASLTLTRCASLTADLATVSTDLAADKAKACQYNASYGTLISLAGSLAPPPASTAIVDAQAYFTKACADPNVLDATTAEWLTTGTDKVVADAQRALGKTAPAP